ncbi:MAG: hypothetical protein IT222_12525 [Crocinitomix sp.]|nr:hypothetical protein [Crocinitomix sp.]
MHCFGFTWSKGEFHFTHNQNILFTWIIRN